MHSNSMYQQAIQYYIPEPTSAVMQLVLVGLSGSAVGN